jgi:hypothetical protein
MRRILALQAKLEAAEDALDFESAASLGLALTALQEQSAQNLSVKEYLTLPARHAALLQRVTEHCKELMSAKDYATLGPLSAKLKVLMALDLAWISSEVAGVPDPVLPSGADTVSPQAAVALGSAADIADDPVLPGGGLAQFSSALCVGSPVEDEDDNAYDPVLPGSG